MRVATERPNVPRKPEFILERATAGMLARVDMGFSHTRPRPTGGTGRREVLEQQGLPSDCGRRDGNQCSPLKHHGRQDPLIHHEWRLQGQIQPSQDRDTQADECKIQGLGSGMPLWIRPWVGKSTKQNLEIFPPVPPAHSDGSFSKLLRLVL